MQDYKFTVTGYSGHEEEALRIRNANRPFARTPEFAAWHYRSLSGAPEPKVFWVRDTADQAVGMISAVYRPCWIDGKQEYFAVMGDLSLASELRGKGIGRQLILFINQYLDQAVPACLGFVMPNVAGEKTVESAGWQGGGRLLLYVMPINLLAKACKMARQLNAPAVKRGIFTAILRQYLSFYVPKGYSVKFNDTLDKDFDGLWEAYSKKGLVLEDRSAASLKWRYLDQPGHDFIIATLHYQNKLVGYAVIKMSDDRRTCEICDLLVAKPHSVECLLAALIIQCIQLYPVIEARIVIGDRHPYFKHLWKLGFVRRATCGSYQSYWPGGRTVNKNFAWMITAGDKDA